MVMKNGAYIMFRRCCTVQAKLVPRDFGIYLNTELTTLLLFELERNNTCQTVGKEWFCNRCIPMGGPFSAESDHLHSMWKPFVDRNPFHELGTLLVTEKGFPDWKCGTALC